MAATRLDSTDMTAKAETHVRGFTLVELMIVVAIMAILVTIAYPSYKQHMMKARRADAEGALLGFANAMERYFTEKGTYTGAAAGGASTGAPASTVYPSQAPLDSSTKYYNLTINAATATTYTLRATPIAGSAQDGDGFLQVDQTGTRAWDKNNDGSIGATEDTW